MVMHVKACFCFCPVQMNLWARLCQMELWKPFLGLLMYLHRCLYVTMTSVTRPDRKARGDDDCWQLNRCWQRYYFSYQLSTNYCLDMYFPTGNGFDLGQWWCYLAASALRSGGAVSSIIQQLSTFVNFRCKINSIRCRTPSPYERVCRYSAHRSTTPNQEHLSHCSSFYYKVGFSSVTWQKPTLTTKIGILLQHWAADYIFV